MNSLDFLKTAFSPFELIHGGSRTDIYEDAVIYNEREDGNALYCELIYNKDIIYSKHFTSTSTLDDSQKDSMRDRFLIQMLSTFGYGLVGVNML